MRPRGVVYPTAQRVGLTSAEDVNESFGKTVMTIPVFIDDVKRIKGFEMTRCVYFQIEGEDSLNPWQLSRDGEQISFLMVGLAGIILTPLDGSPQFTNPKQIDELLRFVESRRVDRGDSELNVELADLWLPNSALPQGGIEVSRGDLLRIGHRLFHLAFAFRDGRLELADFLRFVSDSPDEVTVAQRETRVFEAWAKREIGRANDQGKHDFWLPLKEERHE